MFVFYLDACNTALWKAFFLSSWLVTLVFCYWSARRLLGARGKLRALEKAGVTGAAFEKMKPDQPRNWSLFLVCAAISFGVLLGYVELYTDYSCTPDSIFWVG